MTSFAGSFHASETLVWEQAAVETFNADEPICEAYILRVQPQMRAKRHVVCGFELTSIPSVCQGCTVCIVKGKEGRQTTNA